jgi:hypothetical protein
VSSHNELARLSGGELAHLPAGARQLGARVKPIIRLGMGIQNKTGKGQAIQKTDYFTVRGDERAVAKFKSVYGEQPKRIKIMVPSSLALALDISYRSFIGGGDSEDGGRPLALGFTNFAPLGYVGGPDVLRVWRQDGSYDEVQTEGLDETGQPLDEIARDLNIEVHATFTFTIPEVLGWGSFAQVTSKGKKSANNLAFKLTEIYSAFGARAPWAFNRDEPPLLVLKPDTQMVRFEDKKTGEAKWGKSKIFALDVVIPEAFHDMQDRLLAHQRELAPQGPAAAMYSPPRELPVIEAAPAEESAPAAPVGGHAAGADETNTGAPEPEDAGPGTDLSDEPSLDDEDAHNTAQHDGDIRVAADLASQFHPPNGKYRDMSLSEILAAGENGERWLGWALGKGETLEPAAYRNAVWSFARVYAPAAFQEALAKIEAGATS